MNSPMPTQFAQSDRVTPEAIRRESRQFTDLPLVQQLINAVPDVVMILNRQHQVVFANRALYDLADMNGREDACGLRPGELLNCAHVLESESGCGSTEFCGTCGAAQAILSGLRGKAAVRECRIIQDSGTALDLRVWATPLPFMGQHYIIFTIKDISHEKRRRILERIFFHDIRNTAGIIASYASLLDTLTPQEIQQFGGDIGWISTRLLCEIATQEYIMAAENGDLGVSPAAINPPALLQEMQQYYTYYRPAEGAFIVIEPNLPPVEMISDPALLGRVIGNMVKNALEASAQGDTVTLGYTVSAGRITFVVHNPAFMPRRVQLQIFQRSFSTKGEGRGLGTYSIKLLSENYLHGKVWFETSAQAGTRFFASFPLRWPQSDDADTV